MILLCSWHNTASSAVPQTSLYQIILRLNPGLLRIWHWQSEALTMHYFLLEPSINLCLVTHSLFESKIFWWIRKTVHSMEKRHSPRPQYLCTWWDCRGRSHSWTPQGAGVPRHPAGSGWAGTAHSTPLLTQSRRNPGTNTINGLLAIIRTIYCKENPIYLFLFWELHRLSPNFHIHVSVSDL
jgi:hypothetical protein